jgi:hypothetical protein
MTCKLCSFQTSNAANNENTFDHSGSSSPITPKLKICPKALNITANTLQGAAKNGPIIGIAIVLLTSLS